MLPEKARGCPPQAPSAYWTKRAEAFEAVGSSTAACWADPCNSEPHPSVNCWCGFRAMTSLDALYAFYEDQVHRIGGLAALAKVEMWSRVLGTAPGDDWPRTVRASHARINGILWLDDASWSEELSAYYGVECDKLVEDDDR